MVPRIGILQIQNYKSIAKAEIYLHDMTVLVGPNGSGKSNCLDALSFLQESLTESIELAFRNRGGIGAVRRKSMGHPTNITLGVGIQLDSNTSAVYAIKIAAKADRKFSVAYEVCQVENKKEKTKSRFTVENGKFIREIPGIRAQITPDRLGLSIASATEEFRPVYDFLTSLRFYSITPNSLREHQEPDSGFYLKKDGSNASAVLKKISEAKDKNTYKKICALLPHIAQGIKGVNYHSLGNKDTIQFLQDVGSKNPWKFDALNMSDGTLRVLGLLLAVYQPGFHPVIAIEEPESTVNPAIADIIYQVLDDASKTKQILITTHSPDILDQKYLHDSQIRVVSMDKGKTIISGIADSTRKAIKEKLYTPGELLRIGELLPKED